MKNRIESLIVACGDEVVTTREFCGDEHQAMLDFQSDHAVRFHPLEVKRIKAIVNQTWSDMQQQAGVVAPINSWERININKALESV